MTPGNEGNQEPNGEAASPDTFSSFHDALKTGLILRVVGKVGVEVLAAIMLLVSHPASEKKQITRPAGSVRDTLSFPELPGLTHLT